MNLLTAIAGHVRRRRSEKTSQYLLCRPQGGLNDTLCQIETCWRYAETHRRFLVVDATQSGFLDDFSNYFEPRHGNAAVRLTLDERELSAFNDMDARPDVVSGRIADYRVVYDFSVRNFLEEESGTRMTFDMVHHHSERLLVHHQCGGGGVAVDCLERLKLKESVAAEIADRLSGIDRPYISVHVRNTDLKTDYAAFFETIRPRVAGKRVLLCSDDHACVAEAKRFFGESHVVTISNIPDTGGRPLHDNRALRRYDANVDAIADLLGLALGEDVLFAKTERNTVSGFSKLAHRLNKRPDVVRGLLST